jgi:hypothetical protein
MENKIVILSAVGSTVLMAKLQEKEAQKTLKK